MQSITEKWKSLNEEYANFHILSSTVIFLFVTIFILSLLSDVFLTTRNLTNILMQASVYFILGVGMTLVMDAGGIDISIGSIIGIATTTIGTLIVGMNIHWFLGILGVILVGAICGAFNGFFIVRFNVPPIIVTLGTMTMFRGLAYAFQEGTVYYGFPEQILWFARGRVLGIPASVIVAGVVVAWGYYFSNYTKTGRHISAIGGNEEAARLAGINVKKIKFLVFVIMGILAGIATIIQTGRLDSAQAVAGTGYELHVIASVVLGGTSLAGGEGIMAGTFLGVIILSVLENGLLLAGIGFYWQRVLYGIIFVLVVAYRTMQHKRKN